MERKAQLANLRIDDRAFDSLINTFDRALAHMHKYPRIWIEYLSFMTSQLRITETRHAFDRALKALPITQHNRIWPLYIKFVKNAGVPETTIRIYRRYVKVRQSLFLFVLLFVFAFCVFFVFLCVFFFPASFSNSLF
jgi:pre-mRNA-splicing factor SYF1